MNVVIGKKSDASLYKDALFVRQTVFIEEQHVPKEEEIDEFEQDAVHFVLYDGEKPVGAGRFRTIDDGLGKIERICILPQYRGRGAGKQLMEMIEKFAKEQGIRKVKLNAQTHAEPFYQKLGYHTVSDVFMDAGIPHVTMVKPLL
ncbi:GNAT family N-acetyltransferase [Parageobacillus thermoglucosidasius]|uniref:GNAT family N-acetyltransferase n=1 Tax=Parageobacillus thermoglucosidasius TaxID=1426 RepID=UPI000E15FFBB|nr:GNAT family N-acetyltransferase [Parageobacillus thermoglucosidasius]MED4903199.1 GNAT family N-acetyltransferase [Parageobacillus thermoglucosidasius]MED4915008.1 GNAT family N-acetyltransferase [Parageobacillus thermoglucosidasius]MED4946103.1 GNAT family N-acetyltransferase [Parageobacillus thermoglucosidasius]MED4981529.1 GNAT family N-acetyltransferase [Parageobacillus thermoglucosidasius]RDE28973.1 GNAT family N-acetyltransferase [Parageobacillus thermoglucosidasius]